MSGKTWMRAVTSTITAIFLIVLAGCSGIPPVDETQSTDQTAVVQNSLLALQSSLEDIALRLTALETAPERALGIPPSGPPQTGDTMFTGLANRVVDISGLPYEGSRKAKLAIIEITDYECPFCRAHYRETLPRLRESFIDTGVLRYFIQDYPLSGHKLAERAALVAKCANEQNAFWSFHQAMFEPSVLGNLRDPEALILELGLDATAVSRCRAKQDDELELSRMRSVAVGLGVRGTPTFLVGVIRSDRTVGDITVLPGRQSLQSFQDVINRYKYTQL